MIIYRIPPSSKNKIPRNKFLEDVLDLLETVAVITGNLLIVGDFNIHCDNLSSPETMKFNQLLLDYNLKQQVTEATHELGHIFNCVISRKHDDFVEEINVGELVSDHSLINVAINLRKLPVQRKTITHHKLSSINYDSSRSDIEESVLSIHIPLDLESAATLYNSTLSKVLEKHAALKTCRVSFHGKCPWWSAKIRKAIVDKRNAERKWRHSKLEIDRQLFKSARNNALGLLKRLNSPTMKAKYSSAREIKKDFSVLFSLFSMAN